MSTKPSTTEDVVSSTSDETSEIAITETQAEPAEAVTPATDPAILAAFEAKVIDSIAFLNSVGYRVVGGGVTFGGRQSTGARDTGPKADPKEVREYFDRTGLSNKELADAVGVSVSVISTVGREGGDRWSQAIFDSRKPIWAEARKAKAAALLADLGDEAPEDTAPETTDQAQA